MIQSFVWSNAASQCFISWTDVCLRVSARAHVCVCVSLGFVFFHLCSLPGVHDQARTPWLQGLLLGRKLDMELV